MAINAEPTPGIWTCTENGLVNGEDSRERYKGAVSLDIFDAATWPAELTEEAKANAYIISAAKDLYAANQAAAKHMNSLNIAVVAYLTNKMSDKDFINRCIELSDGPERQRVAHQMNRAAIKACGQKL